MMEWRSVRAEERGRTMKVLLQQTKEHVLAD